MTLGANVLRMQNHPEMTTAFAAELYRARRERMGHATVDAALDSLTRPTDDAAAASWILNFLTR